MDYLLDKTVVQSGFVPKEIQWIVMDVIIRSIEAKEPDELPQAELLTALSF